MRLKISTMLEGEDKDATLLNCKMTFEKSGKYCSKTMQSFYSSQLSQINWTQSLAEGKWQDALVELEKIGKSADKKEFAETKKAWIKYSFIDRLASGDEEK